MLKLPGGRWWSRASLAGAVHWLGWPGAAVVLAGTVLLAAYRLLAERARRKTLVDVVTRSPAGTVIIMEGGPGGPAMWIRVGNGPPALAEATHGAK
jgi:hypothetical protein